LDDGELRLGERIRPFGELAAALAERDEDLQLGLQVGVGELL